jgi:ABC-type Fe3+/spermidine/putrescine transport system ATPase subunit
MTRIQVKGIKKRLGGKEILKGISFDVPSGDIVAFVGPSGCGKTTLLRCILGEIPPDEGQVVFDGEEVTFQRVERRGVGIVYQDYALFPHMTVYENVGYGMRIRKVPAEIIERKVGELLELVKLTGKEQHLPANLSGGEQQRVALARVLATNPRILLLDEAFTALDATTRSELVHQVRKIIQRLNLTTLLVTHDQEEAFLFAKHVVVLNEGQIVVSGDSETVMKNRHPFVQDFVKMVLFKRATVTKDDNGRRYVQVGSAKIPVAMPGVAEGDEVHVMVKKGPDKESVEVWPIDK